MIYLKEEYATIYLEEDYELIHLELHGIIPSNYYRETLDLALDLVYEKKLKKWLGNLKDMGRMQVQDAKWREEIWFPRFIKSTIQKAAIVMSKDFYNELTFYETIEQVEKKSRIERRIFDNVQDAELWLKTEPTYRTQEKVIL